MQKRGPFTEQLLSELVRWVDLGIITASQKTSIEVLYAQQSAEKDVQNKQPAATHPAERINIARVIIGLATLCLAVGIVIFYASNWRRMPPSLKLVQVFFLIAASYGGAWWFLQAERRFSFVGDALLLLGMVCYGAGIMLVAQVYHISSHPANGLLAWGVGCFAMSALMRSRYGLYLSLLLFTVWDIWEYSYFGNAGFLFGLPVLLFAYVFYRARDSKGLVASSLLFSIYFFQIAFYMIERSPKNGIVVYIIIAGLVAAGSAMIFAGKKLGTLSDAKTPGTILLITGWAAWGMPLFQISRLQPDISLPLLVWGCSALVASLVLRDKRGYYVSCALFFIWSLSAKTTPYGYILPVTVLSVLFYSIKDRAGIALSAVSMIYYYFIATRGLMPEGTPYGTESFIFIVLQFPLAALLVTAGRLASGNETLSSGGRIFTIAGWVSLLVPFTAISWPFNIGDIPWLVMPGQYRYQAAEYILLAALSSAGAYLLHKRNEDLKIILAAVILPVAMFFLPLNNNATRMISLHIAALGFMYVLLYYTHIEHEKNSFERRFAFIFAITLIVIKGAGFIYYSVLDDSWTNSLNEFKLTYLNGFLLFATICFLINRFVTETLRADEVEYNGDSIDRICAAGVWVTIYIASFEVEAQKSIFTANSIVIKMTLIFITIAAALYYVLYKKNTGNRVLLNLSLVIFLSAGITLLVSGPWIPWELYSVIFNILLFLTSSVLMYYSSVIQSKRILNFATAGIIIQVFTRYFDLFWDMFSGAMLFIITGILGLAGGYILEKKRKRLTEMIETSAASPDGAREGRK